MKILQSFRSHLLLLVSSQLLLIETLQRLWVPSGGVCFDSPPPSAEVLFFISLAQVSPVLLYYALRERLAANYSHHLAFFLLYTWLLFPLIIFPLLEPNCYPNYPAPVTPLALLLSTLGWMSVLRTARSRKQRYFVLNALPVAVISVFALPLFSCLPLPLGLTRDSSCRIALHGTTEIAIIAAAFIVISLGLLLFTYAAAHSILLLRSAIGWWYELVFMPPESTNGQNISR